MNLPDIQEEAIERFKEKFVSPHTSIPWNRDKMGFFDEDFVLPTDVAKFLSESIESSILAAFEAVEVGHREEEFGYSEEITGFNDAVSQRREKEKEFLNQ